MIECNDVEVMQVEGGTNPLQPLSDVVYEPYATEIQDAIEAVLSLF